jgi:hypothetical protein
MSAFRTLTLKSNINAENYKTNIKYVLVNGNIGDWFVLHMLKKNINEYYYAEIIEELTKKIFERKKLAKKRAEESFTDSIAKQENKLNEVTFSNEKIKASNATTVSSSEKSNPIEGSSLDNGSSLYVDARSTFNSLE